MDKNPLQLDPKLKEAYDRVMGTSVGNTPQQNPPQPHPQEQPKEQPQPQIANQPEPTVHETTVNPSPAPAQVAAAPTQKAVIAEKKKGKISPLVIVLGIIVFFAIYLVVWVKLFNINVPFINPLS